MDTRLIVSLLFNWIRIGFEMHKNFVIFLLFKENLNLKVVRYFVKLIIIVYKYLYNSLIFFVLEFGTIYFVNSSDKVYNFLLFPSCCSLDRKIENTVYIM